MAYGYFLLFIVINIVKLMLMFGRIRQLLKMAVAVEKPN